MAAVVADALARLPAAQFMAAAAAVEMDQYLRREHQLTVGLAEREQQRLRGTTDRLRAVVVVQLGQEQKLEMVPEVS